MLIPNGEKTVFSLFLSDQDATGVTPLNAGSKGLV